MSLFAPCAVCVEKERLITLLTDQNRELQKALVTLVDKRAGAQLFQPPRRERPAPDPRPQVEPSSREEVYLPPLTQEQIERSFVMDQAVEEAALAELAEMAAAGQ